MRTRLILAAAAMLALSACESSKDKAEKYYQSALEYVQKGDPDRAMVELRNVFRFDGTHYEARKELARLLRQKGDIKGAFSQLLRLAEQYPQDAAVRRELAQIAIDVGNWDEAERHGRTAAELAPDAPEQKDLDLTLNYRKAVLAKDAAARAQIVAQARARLAEQPGNVTALRIAVSDTLEGPNPGSAMPDIDALIAAEPTKTEPWLLKLGLLNQLQDRAGVEAHLARMVEQFPDDDTVRTTQAAWYIQQGDSAGAEKVIRAMAEKSGAGTDQKLALVKFLEMERGPDAALAEAEALSAAAPEKSPERQLYDSLRAFYVFNRGERDQGIALLQQALVDAQPSEQTNRLRAMLAGMLLKSGNRAEAEKLTGEVLTADTTNVYALRVKSEMLLADDKANEAIVELRRALDQNPRDVDTLTLMAEAYDRAGNRQLMGETLASAVDISGSAPAPALRYAAFLLRENRRSAARAVLDDALAANPQNVELLVRIGQMALEDKAFGDVKEMAQRLEAITADPQALAAAKGLRADAALREGRLDEGLAMLEERAGEAQGAVGPILSVIRARVLAGQPAEARAYLDEQIKAAPDSVDLQIVNAGLMVTEGKREEARQLLRDVIASHPQLPGPVQLLYAQLQADGLADEANKVLDEAAARLPNNRPIQLMMASRLEREGRIDETIAIYERLYAQDNSDVILANNLASMLATWRSDDPASLTRATAAAQRLKGLAVPAFQDTYGWLLHLNGDTQAALPELTAAATGLPEDPLVQFHLGMALANVAQVEPARLALSRAVELAGDRDLPQMAVAKTKLAELGGAVPTGAAPAAAPAAPAAAPKTAAPAETLSTEPAPVADEASQ